MFNSILPECKLTLSELPSNWKLLFPDYVGIDYNTSNSVCSFSCMLAILQDNNIPKSVFELKNELVELYKPLLTGDISSDLLQLLSTYNYKIETEMIRNNQLTIDDFIINETYRLTPIDIWLLSNKYKLPIVLLNPINFTQTKSSIISINVSSSTAYFIILPKYQQSTTNNNDSKYNMIVNTQIQIPTFFIQFDNLSKTIVDEIKLQTYNITDFIANTINKSMVDSSKIQKKSSKLHTSIRV